MNDVTLDTDRTRRLGFPEIVYAEFKTHNQLAAIVRELLETEQRALLTRISPAKAAYLEKTFGSLTFNAEAGVALLGEWPPVEDRHSLAVVTGGTSDTPVATEVCWTLRFLGIEPVRYFDVGVAGLQRLLDRLEAIRRQKVVIVVAGFEAALASVLCGLVDRPVIGVPTSVGYGVNRNGWTALNAMLGSCANGLTVVNIDNGYGAAIAAYRILRMLKTHGGCA